ncbi:hypothetical protein GCM10008966_00530 [Rhodovulum strictum]
MLILSAAQIARTVLRGQTGFTLNYGRHMRGPSADADLRQALPTGRPHFPWCGERGSPGRANNESYFTTTMLELFEIEESQTCPVPC